MSSATLYYEDIEEGAPVRPMFLYMDQMQLISWAVSSGNRRAGHYDIYSTTAGGGGYPSVTGQLKTALLEKVVMDWLGPKAWIRKMQVQYRKWDYFFDMKKFTGAVVGKRIEDGQGVIELDLQMENSKGEPTTKGKIVVEVPLREAAA